jgi:tRNA-dihydrouridine synthase 3
LLIIAVVLYMYIQECRDSKEWCPTAEERVAVYHKLTVYMKEHFGSDEKGMLRLALSSTITTPV